MYIGFSDVTSNYAVLIKSSSQIGFVHEKSNRDETLPEQCTTSQQVGGREN